ncbi:hypothetical protein [Muribaculum intestinale]|uniref:hypothetical protein n=1 Tax=Muribaculum intestinale TaxID=1796646 RepID=UPI00242DE480|nr:hypothetical protein [Muribaculum intestinale]
MKIGTKRPKCFIPEVVKMTTIKILGLAIIKRIEQKGLYEDRIPRPPEKIRVVTSSLDGTPLDDMPLVRACIEPQEKNPMC